jgi:hypothetical protein
VLTLRYAGGRGQRLEIEPGCEDPRADYTLDEWTLTKGGAWKPAGAEAVTNVDLENVHALGDTPTDALREHLEAAYRHGQSRSAREELREALQLLDAIEEGV